MPPCPRRQARGRTHVDPTFVHPLVPGTGAGSRGGLLVRLSPCSSRSRPVASWQRRTRTWRGASVKPMGGRPVPDGGNEPCSSLWTSGTPRQRSRPKRILARGAPRRRVGGDGAGLRGRAAALAWLKRQGATYGRLAENALDARRYDMAEDQLAEGLEYCSDHGLELFRLYLLSHRARLYLAQGRWAQGARRLSAVFTHPSDVDNAAHHRPDGPRARPGQAGGPRSSTSARRGVGLGPTNR